MKKTRVLFAIPCLMAFLTVTGTPAHADITSAVVYQNIPNPGDAGNSANWASTLPSASFTIGASGIDFTSPPSLYTTAAFLNNPTFSNQVNGFNPNGTANNLELVIDGSLYLNAGDNSFVVGHDDGAVLSIAGFGTVVDKPGPTALSETPFTVNAATAGMYNFHLEYAECCGAPSDLVFTVNDAPVGPSAPEPASFILLGSGLLGFAGVVRRRIGL